jgi:hypothetical protein
VDHPLLCRLQRAPRTQLKKALGMPARRRSAEPVMPCGV